mmetsp:Transcript_8777/g.17678  ORF Transcript_8777/g.17678 Transcript_8777/m.17678 type:complete len:350 (-) Transcript_8777:40-1089(-)
MLVFPALSFRAGPSSRSSTRPSVHMNQAAAKAAWLARQSGGGGPHPSTPWQRVPEAEPDILRTSDGDAATPVREQTEAFNVVLAKVEGLVSELAAASPSVPTEGASAAQLAQLLSDESLDAVIAPHVSLLTMPGYPDAVRSALSTVHTVAQKAALLALTQYMGGVHGMHNEHQPRREGVPAEGSTLVHGQQGKIANATLPMPPPSTSGLSPPQPPNVTTSAQPTFARAIDLNVETPRKDSAAMAEVEERILGARYICRAAIDKRVLKLTQPAFEQYMADQFDAAELDKRKAEAREKATAEHTPLVELECAAAEYKEAVSARREAEAAEDAAEAKLEALLRELEQGQPGC